MSWQEYIPKVIIPNLPHRIDRKERMINLLYEYGIEATIWEAIKHDNGAMGLMLTMKDILKDCLNNGIERVLILEDDCEILVSPDEFHSTLDACVEDLKNIDWKLFYLGANIPINRQSHGSEYLNWVTSNVLHIKMAYSTHALLWSTHAMSFFVNSPILEPIDNWIVREYQEVYKNIFCSYPMLCSQIEDYSDIGGQFTSWKKHLEGSFHDYVRDILPRRFKQTI